MVVQVLKEYWYQEVIGGVLLLSLLFVFFKRRKNKKERKESYHKKLKNQVLNEAIKNGAVNHNIFDHKEVQRPIGFDVKSESAEIFKNENTILRLRISGKTNNDYVVNPENHIFLGSQPGINDILLEGEHIASQQLEVFRYEQQVYIRNLYPERPVYLKRKANQTSIGTRGIRICTGDQVLLGTCRIKMELLDYTGMKK